MKKPIEEELSEAICALSNGKAPGRMLFLLISLRKIKMFFSRMHCCCNAADKTKCHTTCGTPKLLPCTKIREKMASVIIVGEYLSFLWRVKSSQGSF